MHKIVLIDDEKKTQNLLKQIIENFAEDVEIKCLANNVESGIEAIIKHKPDIVFLDIEMPDGTGFDLLQKLSDTNFALIFCTAHNGFAIKAFKYNAIDYILKPFEIEDVISSIERAKKDVEIKHKNSAIKYLLENYNNTERKEDKLILKTISDIFVVEISDIYNCESENGYTTFQFEGNKKITVSKNLKEYQDILKNHNFVKTHQSHLVNMKYIVRIHKKKGNYVILKNDRKIPISSRKKETILLALENLK